MGGLLKMATVKRQEVEAMTSDCRCPSCGAKFPVPADELTLRRIAEAEERLARLEAPLTAARDALGLRPALTVVGDESNGPEQAEQAEAAGPS